MTLSRENRKIAIYTFLPRENKIGVNIKIFLSKYAIIRQVGLTKENIIDRCTDVK